MAKKKEGFRSGSSAKPEQDVQNLLDKRGAGRAPSIDTAAVSDNKEATPAKGQEGGRPEKESSDYTTVMDDILSLVDEKESVSLTELEKKFGVKYSRLEEWGRILDKNGLMELEYPMVGDVMLRKKGYAERHAKKKGVKKAKPEEKGKGKKEEPREKAEAGKKEEAKPEEKAKADSEGEHKADAGGEADKKETKPEGEKKKLSKKKFRLIMIGMVVVIVALVCVLIYSLVKGGYIKLV